MSADKPFTGYQDYSKVAFSYDSVRVPFGFEIILGTLARYAKEKPLSSLHILEAACGTGNFTEVLHDYVGHITAVDNSDGMLARTSEKLKGASNITIQNVDLKKQLPFESEKFDAVLVVYAIHHLDAVQEDGTNTGENLKAAIKEFSRVLKKGAPLIICHARENQMMKCIWYFYFCCENGFSDVIKPHMRRFLSFDRVTKFCEEAGFKSQPQMSSVSELFIKPEVYYNVNNPLTPEFRANDSAWRDIEKQERFPQFLEAYKQAVEKNEMEKWIKESDEIRLREGMNTFLTYTKL